MVNTSQLLGRDDSSSSSFIIVAPGPETLASASLTANLVLRVTLSILANLTCLVPLKHLYRNGEFAAVIFILNIQFTNFNTVLNALIWHDDDTDNWWAGYGLCDLQPYTHNFSVTLFVTCLLAIMRNLAQQVGLLTANPMTVQERRRRNLVQALIMFPLPVIQLAWIWPLTAQRYVVGTLVGCSWVAWPSWPYVVFFIVAPVVVSLATAGYAGMFISSLHPPTRWSTDWQVLTYTRFREIARTTQSALSSNRIANRRAQRTKRRLYLMVISILAPFLPIIITLAVLNILAAGTLKPFDYRTIHNQPFPNQWQSIIFLPSNNIGFVYMSNAYISILAAIPIFLSFGMTKGAMNSYRRGLLFIGLGRIFPKLHEVYDPDRDVYTTGSGNSYLMGSTATS